MTIEKAVSLVKPHAHLAKIDLKSAYCENLTYLYNCKLPFGAAKSPEIFHRLTQAIVRMMDRWGFKVVIAYLDDFLIICDTEHECRQAYHELITLLSELGELGQGCWTLPMTDFHGYQNR